MKVIGFAQLHNELSNGNLKNWFNSMNSVCDYIYIYDQASTDGSKEYYKLQSNVTVIESPINDFENELICKQKLLDKIRTDIPDYDWILWLDGDVILDGRLTRPILDNILLNTDSDALSLGHLNLWRSDIYYRKDNGFHSLNVGVLAFWKNESYLNFEQLSGLHKGMYPNGFKKVTRIPYNIIHRGFSTDEQIINRLLSYRNFKNQGNLNATIKRFLDEDHLDLEKLDYNILPKWFNIKDEQNPKGKPKLNVLYKGMI